VIFNLGYAYSRRGGDTRKHLTGYAKLKKRKNKERHFGISTEIRARKIRTDVGKFSFVPRVEAGKNTSTIIPASCKRRQKGNPVVSGETVPADLRERLMRNYHWISLFKSYI
jgi:hypothetical protein